MFGTTEHSTDIITNCNMKHIKYLQFKSGQCCILEVGTCTNYKLQCHNNINYTRWFKKKRFTINDSPICIIAYLHYFLI